MAAISKTKGDLGEAIIMADAAKKGYKVAIPIGDDWDYDLIVLRNKKLERIQCKYVESKDGLMIVPCRSKSTGGRVKKYTEQMIEWLAIYDKTTDKCYYIPADLLGQGKCNLNLRFLKTKNGQKKKIHMAEDFLNF